ncbi:Polysaccharide pyruvyl transferase [Hydrogenophaga sp. T4]|nr:Polysaccharide pyruvyl transferase [Hydrogenophaga sp. T4]
MSSNRPLRIGILTFHFSDNYGAALQAYALRRWFVEHGHEPRFIDYKPAHIERGGQLTLPTSPAKLKANLKTIYLTASSFANRHFGNRGQREKFTLFREHFLGIKNGSTLSDTYETLDAARSFDLIVAGSDQIWSPSQHFGFDPNYFLAFAGNYRARKISYAASFGRDQVSSSEEAQLPNLLQNFDAISVREASGIPLVERAIGCRPANVPDPTLLHNNYSELTDRASYKHEDPYIFCYGLRSPDNIRQTADLVSKQLKCPILSPHNPHRRWIEIGNTVYPDPSEWVSLMKNARFVVTNSFHGTVFALLFKKPFIVAGLTGERVSANARAINLLRAVHLESRFTSTFSEQHVKTLMANEIDWAEVDKRLADLRQTGNEFLTMQLEAAAP